MKVGPSESRVPAPPDGSLASVKFQVRAFSFVSTSFLLHIGTILGGFSIGVLGGLVLRGGDCIPGPLHTGFFGLCLEAIIGLLLYVLLGYQVQFMPGFPIKRA